MLTSCSTAYFLAQRNTLETSCTFVSWSTEISQLLKDYASFSMKNVTEDIDLSQTYSLPGNMWVTLFLDLFHKCVMNMHIWNTYPHIELITAVLSKHNPHQFQFQHNSQVLLPFPHEWKIWYTRELSFVQEDFEAYQWYEKRENRLKKELNV